MVTLNIFWDELLQLNCIEHTFVRNQAKHGMYLENIPFYYIQVVSPKEEDYHEQPTNKHTSTSKYHQILLWNIVLIICQKVCQCSIVNQFKIVAHSSYIFEKYIIQIGCFLCQVIFTNVRILIDESVCTLYIAEQGRNKPFRQHLVVNTHTVFFIAFSVEEVTRRRKKSIFL